MKSLFRNTGYEANDSHIDIIEMKLKIYLKLTNWRKISIKDIIFHYGKYVYNLFYISIFLDQSFDKGYNIVIENKTNQNSLT